ncbi:hypothetical protein WMF45_46015 [Sorangium sp. So ce448]|uniref:hypothetical protein n=1 Tax=Sorangium sp. So ce448 TaxID=3133314 RepID=UPI003F6046CC
MDGESRTMSAGVALLPVEQRRAIRAETLASFRRFAETVLRLRPRLRSIAFQVRRGFRGIQHGLRYACDATPPAEHRCGDASSWCNFCEVWDDYLPWTSWLKGWDERPGNAEAFLAYCKDDVTFTTYALVRRARGNFLSRCLKLTDPVSVEIVAPLLQPWFEPDGAIDQIVRSSAELRPWLDAVYATPAERAPKRALAERLVAAGDPRGAYIVEQLGTGGLDRGKTSALGAHWAEWLGPLRVVVGPSGMAFSEGFPEVVSACFASDAAVAACAEDPAWSTVEQLELLDPRDFPLREGVFIDDIQPITRAMKSLQVLDGVRSSGLRSLEALGTELPLWRLGAKLASTDDLERLLRVQCLPELTSLDLEIEFSMVPESTVWKQLWDLAPWGRTLTDLTVRVVAHLELWSSAPARPGVRLIHSDSAGWLELEASEGGKFANARFRARMRDLDGLIERLSRLPSLEQVELDLGQGALMSADEQAAFEHALARIHPAARLVTKEQLASERTTFS